MRSDWTLVELGELAEEITVGFVGSMTHEYIDIGIPFFRSKNISEYEIDWNDIRYISDKFHAKLKKSVLRPGDVAIVRTGKPGTTCVIPDTVEEANCSDIVIVRVNDELLSAHYLSYFMNSVANHQISSHLVGAVQQHFNVGSAKKIMIPLPSRNEQELIVKILKDLDDKNKLNRQTNQILEQIAQAIFKSWFVDFGPVKAKMAAKQEGASAEQIEQAAICAISGKTPEQLAQLDPQTLQQLKTTAALFPDVLVDSELGETPEGWESTSLSSWGEIVCGKTPPTMNKEYYGGGIPFIKIPDMHGTMFAVETTDTLTQAGAEMQIKKILPKGSVCVSCIATVGQVLITYKESFTNQQINSIVPTDKCFSSYLYFSMLNLNSHLHDLASGGSATLNLNTGNFSKIEIIKPDSGVLEHFSKTVEPMISEILVNSYQQKHLSQVRDTLLPKLLSGEITLSNQDEAA